jgi:hypothetical protein
MRVDEHITALTEMTNWIASGTMNRMMKIRTHTRTHTRLLLEAFHLSGSVAYDPPFEGAQMDIDRTSSNMCKIQ